MLVLSFIPAQCQHCHMPPAGVPGRGYPQQSNVHVRLTSKGVNLTRSFPGLRTGKQKIEIVCCNRRHDLLLGYGMFRVNHSQGVESFESRIRRLNALSVPSI
jgi:hypothetical protein